MTFYSLLLTGLALIASAPFSTALSYERLDETGTFSMETAMLVYKPPFPILTDHPSVSTSTVLTLTPTFADRASSTLSASFVSYTLSPYFPAGLLSHSTIFRVTSTVTLNPTTVTLERFDHELFIFVTKPETLITQITIQSTVYVTDSLETETPSAFSDSYIDKLYAANRDLKSWQIFFAAITALFTLVTAALVANWKIHWGRDARDLKAISAGIIEDESTDEDDDDDDDDDASLGVAN